MLLEVLNSVRTNMKTEASTALSLYLPRDLVRTLDQSRGPFSRSRLIVLVLEDAVKRGIDLAKLVTIPQTTNLREDVRA